jgi:hypothetical protein
MTALMAYYRRFRHRHLDQRVKWVEEARRTRPVSDGR